MVAEARERDLYDVLDVLPPDQFEVDRVSDGVLALKHILEAFNSSTSPSYDALLCSRDLPGMGAIELTKLLRQHEAQRSIAQGGLPDRLRVICFTDEVAPDDLR